MQIINLSHNDSIDAIVEKCNLNFKELAFSTSQSIKKQSRIDTSDVASAINQIVSDLTNIVIPNEVAAQIGTGSTTTVSDFITADQDVVITSGIAHRWGKIAKISLSYRLANSYSVMSDGKINNIDVGVLTSDWMTVGGLTNINLDSTYNIQGVIDNNGRIAIMSANSRGTTYTIDQNAVLYAGFTYMLA